MISKIRSFCSPHFGKQYVREFRNLAMRFGPEKDVRFGWRKLPPKRWKNEFPIIFWKPTDEWIEKIDSLIDTLRKLNQTECFMLYCKVLYQTNNRIYEVVATGDSGSHDETYYDAATSW